MKKTIIIILSILMSCTILGIMRKYYINYNIARQNTTYIDKLTNIRNELSAKSTKKAKITDFFHYKKFIEVNTDELKKDNEIINHLHVK